MELILILFLFIVILPLHKRYIISKFIIENYLSTIYEITGENEIFYDICDNIKTPLTLAFNVKNEIESISDCVYDIECFNSTIEMINSYTRMMLEANDEKNDN